MSDLGKRESYSTQIERVRVEVGVTVLERVVVLKDCVLSCLSFFSNMERVYQVAAASTSELHDVRNLTFL